VSGHADELARDAAARRAAQTEFDAPLVVEAGAGTGKTTTLVGRILVWCLGRGWDEVRERVAAEEEGSGQEAEAASAAQRRSGPEDLDRLAGEVLDRVTAITFTEAAAAEMAGRIARDLAAVASGRLDELPGIDPDLLPPAAVAAERARALLGTLDRLNVRTIHAFCRSLLARHPLEAGLHPDLEVDPDGSKVEEIVRDLVESRSREAYQSPGASPLLDLATLGYGPRQVAEALRELAVRAFPPQVLARSPFDAEGVERMTRRLAERLLAFAVADGGGFATVAGAKAKAPQAAAMVAATLELLDGEGEASGDPVRRADQLVRSLRGLWSERAVESWLKDWSRGDFTGAESGALGGRAAVLAEAAGGLRSVLRHYLKMDPVLLETARRCLAELLAEAGEALRRRGIITFDALLRETRDLLAGNRDVLRGEQRRVRQLLVDEFQDTDAIQCEIVRLLALDGTLDRAPDPAGSSAAGHRGLFLVGDPKQTIFGWRNADLEAYEEMVAAALAAGGRRVSLLRNFRSVAPLLAEVNRVVEPVMTEQPGLQPRYEPLVPAKEESAGPPSAQADGAGAATPAVEYWLSWEAGDGAARKPASNTEAAEIEARAVADDIAARYRETGTWGAFALLFRATTWQESYLEALRARGIPFRVTRDKHYYRRREIIDAAALVRTVVHPADQLALVTWLRSPTVGVPDAAWIPLWRHRLPEAMIGLDAPSRRRLDHLRGVVEAAARELPEGIPGIDRIAGWSESLIDAVEAIAELRQIWRDAPLDLAIRRLRERVLVECTESARFLGAYRLANLERFFRRLRDSLEESGGDAQAVLRGIRRGVSEAWEAEEAMPHESTTEAVQVSTIHAAKGLEYEHVYLVQTHGWSPGEQARSVDLNEREESGQPAEYALLGACTPGFDRVIERREALAAAERVRTLYVALTRARRRLVVVGDWPSRIEPKPAEHAANHVELLLHRWPESEGLQGHRLARSALIDAHGALWRLVPTAAASAAAKARAGREEAETPGAPAPLAQAESETRQLIEERRLARLRMNRPRITPASSESGERLGRRPEKRRTVGAGDGSVADGSSATGGLREAALAAGDAMHRILEGWDLSADPAAELATGRQRGLERLSGLPPEPRELATRRLGEILGRFAHGTLLTRFAGLADRVMGREVPMLLGQPEGVAAERPPLGAWSGAIDLLYRDRESGRPVIVDFKTDAVEDDEVAERAAAYSVQEAVYREAVRRAFGLAEPPEFELWFLWPDRLWTVS
jgi:ATP-dependent exoDNAse (exonuclease V) beta subunit